jgi:hypothetical protein
VTRCAVPIPFIHTVPPSYGALWLFGLFDFFF